MTQELTDREEVIGTLLIQGYSAEGMADILNIRLHTIRRHLSVIYSKLEVNDNWRWNPRTRAAYVLRKRNDLQQR